MAAKKGDANGQYAFGTLLGMGKKWLKINHKKSYELLTKASDKNHFYSLYNFVQGMVFGLKYFSCHQARELLLSIQKNTIFGFFNNFSLKNLRSKNYMAAAIGYLTNTIWNSDMDMGNFYVLFNKYLPEINLEEYFQNYDDVFKKDKILKMIKNKFEIKLERIADFVKIEGKNLEVFQNKFNIFSLERLKKEKNYLKPIERKIEKILINQRKLANISLHKLKKLYYKKLNSKKKFLRFQKIYSETIDLLEKGTEPLFIKTNKNLNLSETHFTYAKGVYFFGKEYIEKKEDKIYLDISFENFKKALSYKKSRKIIYILYYCLVKLHIWFNEFYVYFDDIKNEIFLFFCFIHMFFIIDYFKKKMKKFYKRRYIE